MKTPSERRIRIRELEKIIECNKVQLRCIHTTMNNDQFYVSSKSRLIEILDRAEVQLRRLEDDRMNGPAIAEGLLQRRQELREEINLLKHEESIEKLLVLQAKISDLVNPQEDESADKDEDEGEDEGSKP